MKYGSLDRYEGKVVFSHTPHVAVPPERQKGVLLRVGGKSNRWDGAGRLVKSYGHLWG